MGSEGPFVAGRRVADGEVQCSFPPPRPDSGVLPEAPGGTRVPSTGHRCHPASPNGTVKEQGVTKSEKARGGPSGINRSSPIVFPMWKVRP